MLWDHIYGPSDDSQYISLFSGFRVTDETKLQKEHIQHYLWPEEADKASAWIDAKSHDGREVYTCAHLVLALPDDKGIRRPRRMKKHATPLWALYVDGDGATVPNHLPAPTAVVRSSPGREQYYWRLSRPVSPEIGEHLNRRLAYAMRADRSGWDLTQLLRPPGTPNRKYPDTPTVTLAYLDDTTAYDPDELDHIIPAAPAASSERTHDVADIGDAPPVDTITGSDLALWRGETPALKDGGETDRSTTLFRIGAMLWRHGVTASWIVAALAERDQSLGLLRYVDRPDEYRRIAAKVSETPRLHIPAVPLAAPRESDNRMTALEARFDQLEAAHRDLRQRHSDMIQMLMNPNLSATEAVAWVLIVSEIEKKQAAGKITDDGRCPVYLGEIGKGYLKREETADPDTGSIVVVETIVDKPRFSNATLSRALKKFHDWGMIERSEVPTKNKHGAPITALYVKPVHATTRETIKALATYVPTRIDPDTGHEKRHGGSVPRAERPARCPDHPTADVFAVCRECDLIVGILTPSATVFVDAPFQHETGEIPQKPVNSVPMENNMKRAPDDVAPMLAAALIHDETGSGPTCRYCPSPLYNPDSIARGTCALHAAGGAD